MTKGAYVLSSTLLPLALTSVQNQQQKHKELQQQQRQQQQQQQQQQHAFLLHSYFLILVYYAPPPHLSTPSTSPASFSAPTVFPPPVHSFCRYVVKVCTCLNNTPAPTHPHAHASRKVINHLKHTHPYRCPKVVYVQEGDAQGEQPPNKCNNRKNSDHPNDPIYSTHLTNLEHVWLNSLLEDKTVLGYSYDDFLMSVKEDVCRALNNE